MEKSMRWRFCWMMAACWAEREGEDGREDEGVEEGEEMGVLDR